MGAYKYRLKCVTDNTLEYVIADSNPTVCPINPAHTIDPISICIVESDKLVNDGSGKELSLAEYKQLRFNEIDGKTVALISAGFTYDSKQFSLSLNAQINWTNVKANESEFIFPLDITTKDNDKYSLDQANVGAFYNAGKDTVKNHLDSGRDLKKSVFDAADEAAVDAIVDSR